MLLKGQKQQSLQFLTFLFKGTYWIIREGIAVL